MKYIIIARTESVERIEEMIWANHIPDIVVPGHIGERSGLFRKDSTGLFRSLGYACYSSWFSTSILFYREKKTVNLKILQ